MADRLLAPVPVAHIPDGMTTAAAQGRVAFGSNAFDLFERLQRRGAIGVLPIYVVASRTGQDRAGRSEFEVGNAHLKGVLSGVASANRRGQHPDPELRPVSALETDGAWALFWEISAVERLQPPWALTHFTTASGQPWLRVPEGPTEANYAQQ